jgi:hypothetical protein
VSFDPFVAIEELYVTWRRSHETGAHDFDQALAKAICGLRKAYWTTEHPRLLTRFERLAYLIQYVPIGIRSASELMRRVCAKACLPPQWSYCRPCRSHPKGTLY